LDSYLGGEHHTIGLRWVYVDLYEPDPVGTNVIESVGFPQGNGNTSNVVFSMNFSATNATPTRRLARPVTLEAACFLTTLLAANWELAGLMVSYTKFSGQVWNASVYGNSTYAIQLSSYRNQILSYLTPGDLNGDSIVNIADISKVAVNWLTTSTDGDANHDGIVNISDVSYIASNWGSVGGGGDAIGVPEPETYALAICALLGVFPLALRRFIRRRSPAGYGSRS